MVPAIVEQIRENMLNKSNPENIRFNYRMTIESIRDYCDMALREYDKKGKRR
jgi:uncharacterized protein YutE (UPF0331/DUF86 family)